MVARRLLVVLMALSLVVLAFGCAKKQTVEDPVDPGGEIPDIEEVDETPETTEDPPSRDVDVAPSLEDVFYAFDKYNLTAESKRILERNAKELKEHSGYTLKIEGHCDERGTKSYNMALGEKRAKAARDYLVALGVSGSRITVISYGKERPFASGHNESAWAKNRRAHMVVKK